MFYAHFVLSKKGPLARIWLAAHWDKKLTKAHVFETNIESSVEGILQPKVKMALRTSGHLLLGVVRIYSRKAKYLLADCNEAFIKIKMAFRPGVVDLPEENREAAVATITLPEVFHDFDTAMPDLNDIEVHAQFTLNQSRAEEITMREDYGNITLVGDDGFGDMGFEDAEIVRDASTMDDALDQAGLLFGDKKDKEDGHSTVASNTANHSTLDKHINLELDAPLRDDGFGGGVGEGLLSAETGGLFEPGGLFDDAPMEHVPLDNSAEDRLAAPRNEEKKPAGSDDEDDYYDMGPPSMGAPSSGPSSPPSPPVPVENGEAVPTDKPEEIPPVPDQTVLIHNEEETFALAPLDSTTTQGIEKNKAKRKRKLIVDEVKNISGEEMKSQLSDTTDIVTTLDLAPPTKRLMHWKETGGVEKLFALPGRPIPSRILSKLYQRHLTTRAVENEDFGVVIEEENLELETVEKEKDELVTPQLPPPPSLPPNEPVVTPIPAITTASITTATTTTTSTPRTTRKRRHDPDPPLIQQQQQMIDPALVQPFDTSLQYQMHMTSTQLPNLQENHQIPVANDLSHLHQDITPITHMSPQGQPLPQIMSPNHISPLPISTPLSTTQRANILSPEPSFMMDQQQQQPGVMTPRHEATSGDSSHVPVNENEFDKQQQQQQQQDDAFNPASVNSFMHELRPQPTPYNMQEEDDEMECPASVGPQEEQGADETYEQFEERVLNKRAQQMLHVVKSRFDRQNEVKFADLVRFNNRKQVAQKFYTFLVLKKQQAVELTQETPFGDLVITPGPKLESLY